MKRRPLISVVMSVYNCEKYINEAIESILNQTYSNLEFIIVNDGSTDSSLDIIQYHMKNDQRIVLLNRENKGLPFSLNEGIKKSKGKYIARMDADDISILSRLEEQLEYILKHNLDLVYSDTLLIDKNGEEICATYRPKNVEKVLSNLEIHNFIPHPTILIKSDVFEKYGFYNILYKTGQDLELWLRLRGKINFGYYNKCLLKYRLNPNSVRAGIYNNYWFKVANYAIWNNHKKQVFKYFSNLSIQEQIIILIKVIIPFRFFYKKFK